MKRTLLRWTRFPLLVLLLLLSQPPMQAAERVQRLVHRADEAFARLAYREALDLYLQAATKAGPNEHLDRQVGHCYLRLGRPAEAEPWLGRSVKYLHRTDADVLAYAEVLRALERYDEYAQWMELVSTTSDATATDRTRLAVEEVNRLRSTSTHFVVEPLAINSAHDEFSPAWHGNGQVIFSSNRPRISTLAVRDGWTGEAFSCLYIADRRTNNTLDEPRLLDGLFDNYTHQGPAAVGADAALYYSTSTSGSEGSQLRIHRAVYKGGINWQAAGDVQLEGWNASAFHPTLSADGLQMVFASDASAGPGGVDLYTTRWEAERWTPPVALAAPVNSPGNEVFPYLASDGVLYFASNGHPGLGGFDIFRCEPDGQGGFLPPQNLGLPINSSRDDLGFIVDRSGKNGYFTSNRPGGAGGDDLYAFRLTGDLQPAPYLLTGAVLLTDGEPYRSGTWVYLQDAAGTRLDSVVSDTKGAYRFAISPRSDLWLEASVPGHVGGAVPVGRPDPLQRAVLCDLPLVDEEGLWVDGLVVDAATGLPLDDATVTVTNATTFHSTTLRTARPGLFRMRVASNESYLVSVGRAGYFTTGTEVHTTGLRDGLLSLDDAPALRLERMQLEMPLPQCSTAACTQLLADRLGWNPELSVELWSSGPEHAAALQAVVAGLEAEGLRRSRVKVLPAGPECGAEGVCLRLRGPLNTVTAP
jgi:hypothetical protein